MRTEVTRITTTSVQILVIAVLVVFAVVVFGPLQAEVQRRVDTVKDDLIELLETLTGREIRYSGIAPAIFRYVEIRDLELLESGSPEPALTINRIRVYYDLFAILAGSTQGAITEISLEDTDFVLDLQEDRDLLELFEDLSAGDGPSILPPNATISGRGLSLALSSGSTTFDASNLNFRARLGEESLDVRASARASVTVGEVDFATSFSANGRIAEDFSSSSVTVSLGEIDTGLFRLRGRSYFVRYDQDLISLTKVADRSPVDIRAEINLGENLLRASFEGDGFVAGDLVTLGPDLAEANRWLSTAVSGNGSILIDLESGDIGYQADLVGRLPPEVVRGGALADALGPQISLEGMRIEAVVTGDLDSLILERIAARGDFGSLSFDGVYILGEPAPRGTLAVDGLRFADLPVVSGSVFVSPREGAGGAAGDTAQDILFSTSGLRIADVTSVSGGATLAADGRSLSFDAMLSVTEGSVRGRGGLDLITGELSDLVLFLRNVDPADLLAPAALVAPDLPTTLPDVVPRDLRLSATLLARLGRVTSLSSSDLVLRSDILGGTTLRAAGRFENESLFLERVSVEAPELSAQGGIEARFHESGDVSFATSFRFNEQDYRLSGVYRDDGTARLEGSYGLEAEISADATGGFRFQGGATGIPIVIADREVVVSFQGLVEGSSPEDFVADLDRLHIRNVPLVPNADSTLTMSGRFTPSSATIRSAEFVDEFSRLTGAGTVGYDLTGPLEVRADLVLSGEADGESYRVIGSYSETGILGTIEATRAPLGRFVELPIEGAVNAAVALDGPLDALQASGTVELVDGSLEGDPLSIRGTFAYGPTAVAVRDLEVRYIDNRISDGVLSLNTETLEARVQAAYRNDTGTEPVVIGIDGSIDFAPGDPTAVADPLAILQRAFTGTVSLDGMPFGEELGGVWQVVLQREEGLLSLRGGPNNAVSATIADDGIFTVSLGRPFPISFDGEGTFTDGLLEADLSPVLVNARDIPGLLDFGDLVIDSGVATGNLRVTGPVTDPEFYGTLTARGLEGALSIVPARLGPAEISFVFEEKSVRMFPATVQAGDARARIEGVFSVSRWALDSYQIGIGVDPANAAAMEGTFGGVSVEGLATGDLLISGGPTGMSVTGNVIAQATTITLAPPAEQVEGEPEIDWTTTIDVGVVSGRNVQFLWPSREFPVLRATAEIGESLDIYLAGDTDDFAMVGDVEVSGGEIFYYDRSFFIREGVIRFNESEASFDPRVSVRAEIREVGAEGPIRIALVTENSPLSELAVRFESDSNLTNQEILAILGGSFFSPTDGAPLDLGEALSLTGDIVGQLSLVRSFENSVREALQLDLFALRTHVIGNILRGVVDDNRSPLDSTVPSLGEYLDNTTLFLGKYLGTDVFLELLVQLRAQSVAADTLLGIGGVSIDSELSLEFETPFFLLEWNFSPRTPENLFLTDNIFSFTWEFSY